MNAQDNYRKRKIIIGMASLALANFLNQQEVVHAEENQQITDQSQSEQLNVPEDIAEVSEEATENSTTEDLESEASTIDNSKMVESETEEVPSSEDTEPAEETNDVEGVDEDDTSTEEMLKTCNLIEKDCDITVSEIKKTTEVEMEAAFDASEGTHSKKVKNEDNPAHDHTRADYEEFYGPGDLEFNYWNSEHAQKYSESYRVNFGTEHAIDNAKLVVEMPYDIERLLEQGKFNVTNASQWLVDRLFAGNSKYDRLLEENNYHIEGNKIIFSLGNIGARTAGSFELQTSFADKEAYDAQMNGENRSVRSYIVGDYNFDYIELPTRTETIQLRNYQGTIPGLTQDEMVKGLEHEVIEEVTRPGYQETENGYTSYKKTTYRVLDVRKVYDQVNDIEYICYDIDQIIEFLPKFKLNAESVMDTTLENYSNNGYLKKVMNPNNHGNLADIDNDGVIDSVGLFGPGNLEVQHWQNGPNEATTQQNWRIAYATDYAVENGVITVKVPYEITLDDVDITEVTKWLADRYYPAVTNKAYYSNLNTLLGMDLLEKAQIEIIDGISTLTFDFSDFVIPARTTIGLRITKNFAEPQDFSENKQHVVVEVDGDWYFNNIELPYNVKQITVECEECKLPESEEPEETEEPSDTENPDDPDNTEKPEQEEETEMPKKEESENTSIEETEENTNADSKDDSNEAIQKTEASESGKENNKLPKTGEASSILPFFGGFLAIFSGVSLIFLNNKKKEK